ncbi:MAG: elongation factor P maturation arginine rhamnosyltransferase EarP [Treponema sp.]|nr:elongation factor P maturation arginine rhamnosyltransferase EarP [Treponema sp.]
MSFSLDITFLCKVVDNYGDIGFVYRLARALNACRPEIRLRIVTDNMESFSQLAPEVNAYASVQQYNGWTLYDWNADDVCTASFSADQPKIILECFQCGYPDWLETLLFKTKCRDSVQIINIDYLTAEPYADDFHCLASLTRSAAVKKVNFMPGFTEHTGGLVLDGPFASDRPAVYAAAHAGNSVQHLLAGFPHDFKVLVFSYERDFTPVVKALSLFERSRQKDSPAFRLRVFAAEGRGKKSFMEAWNTEKKPFAVTELTFLSQPEWDYVLCSMSFSFVRGEDSLSRACLAGIPFVWHAYPQADEYQQIKVQALVERIKPFFENEDAGLIEKFWYLYNVTSPQVSGQEQTELLYTLLDRTERLGICFSSFAQMLRRNGDFAQHLISYLDGLI